MWAITLAQSVKLGYTSMPKISIEPLVDDDVVEIGSNGDFEVSSISSAYASRLEDLAELSRRWHKETWDRMTVFALPQVALAIDFTNALQRRGIPAVVVHAGTPYAQRRAAFDLLTSRLAALVQVSVVGEGVDLPIRRIVDAYPRMSPVAFMQMFGRGTRPVDEDEPPPDYVCIAEGEPVLTDSGWKPIETVGIDDLVWDGVGWVHHDGVVCNGVRETIEVAGVRMTPDHLVLTTKGWREAWDVLESKLTPSFPSVDGSSVGPWSMMSPEELDVKSLFSADVNAVSRAGSRSRILDTSARVNVRHVPVDLTHPNASTERTSLRRTTEDLGLELNLGSEVVRIKLDGAIQTTVVGGSKFAPNGWKIRESSSPISQPFRDGMTHRSRSIASITTGTTNPETFGSSHGPSKPITVADQSLVPSDRPTKVYDLVNCGPWSRYQVRSLIVHNCTNRNVSRFAYLLDGLCPPSAVAESDRLFGGPSKRGGYRALGLEALGRFKGSEVRLLNGTTALFYQLVDVAQGRLREFACLVPPTTAESIWAERVHGVKSDGSRDYGTYRRCEPPADLRGFSGGSSKEGTPKMVDWWKRSAATRGLDPNVEPKRKVFAVLPFMLNLGISFR